MEDLSPNLFFCDLRIVGPGFCSQGLYSTQNVTFFILISAYYVLELNSVLLRMKTFTSIRQIDSMQSMEMNTTLMVK